MTFMHVLTNLRHLALISLIDRLIHPPSVLRRLPLTSPDENYAGLLYTRLV